MTKLITSSLPLLPLAVAPSVVNADNAVVMWILGFAGVMVIFNQGAQAYKTLTSGLKEYPSPSQTYATKADCTTKHNHVDKRFDDVNSRFDVSDKRAEQRVTALHNRINDVLAAVSRLEGKVSK